MEKLEIILNKHKEWHWFLCSLFLFNFINKNVFFNSHILCFVWYRNWYREPWIFTGIGTEYRNFGTVTTLVNSTVSVPNVVSCQLEAVYSESNESVSKLSYTNIHLQTI